MAHEWWGYWDCIYLSFVYLSLKEFGVVGSDMYTWGIKDFHKCWSGSLAKRRLCLGPTRVINCTPLSALSFWVNLFPGTCGYNNRRLTTIHFLNLNQVKLQRGFPGGSVVKNLPTNNEGDVNLDPWVGKIPWRRKWQPTPVFLPGKSHGQRSLAL